MDMDRTQPVELVNMCMIMDPATQKVVVQDKTDVAWKFGHTFPGGHVELGEPIEAAMQREVYEETGLTVSQLQSCGLVEWFDQPAGYRKIGFLFKTDHFTGTLKQSAEGRNLWLPLSALNRDNTAESFMEMLAIFTGQATVATATIMNGPLTLSTSANQCDDK
ncbi:8-oxo-dGTP diphosphatase [uncultured Secundilactobacillus sp.]|uniref:8-oxo-dGTP diphosphatase n=1 Tax=uncultured Secundilactobacillus sp. TaxID=2813935 RepID=UPI00258FA410|nr:8-oxo-dGTP diphosphatase [uncultured Secundilactobacillus sp.]